MLALRVLVTALALTSLLSGTCAACDEGWAERGDFEGQQAVQFTVDDNFTLESFQGQMFSYQRFLSDTRAIRVAAGLFLDRDDRDMEEELSGGDYVGSADVTYWKYEGTLKIQMLFYRGAGPVRFFYGAGPKFSISDYHNEYVDFFTSGGDLEYRIRTDDTDEWSFGLQAMAGVEWFINDMFALHAEYGVSGMYVFSENVDEEVHSSNDAYSWRRATTTSSPEFTSDGVRFGLSVHF